MPSNSGSVDVDFTVPFLKNLKKLSKRYRRIRSDLRPLIDQLSAGELPGVQLTGVDLPIFKVRLKNSDTKKGKSGGYRVVYYVKTQSQIILMIIFSKSDIPNIETSELMKILVEYEKSSECSFCC